MVLRLVESLRTAGVDVAMVELLDAAHALRHLRLADRSLLRTTLRATLVKRLEDGPVFDVLFDRCFPMTRSGRPDPEAATAGHPNVGAEAPPPLAPSADGGPGPDREVAAPRTDLLEAILAALRSGDDAALRALAAAAVDAHAGTPATTGSERYFLFRVLRALDLAALVSAAARADRADARAGDGTVDELALRLRRDEMARRVEVLRQLIAAEIRCRLPAGDHVPARRLDELDLVHASTLDLRAMRLAVKPLARKLAARVAARRRLHRLGRLEVRRTIRRSLGAGGVPMEPAFRRRRATKPELVVLCDLSGSVAEFATFTLGLVHALHNELAGSRTFVFVDGVAEVTDLVARADGVPEPRNLLTLAGVVAADGHSDYGRVFERFWHEHAKHGVGPSTTLIVTGDARTNYRGAGLDPFRQLCGRAKRVYWLNPEPRADWDTTDSVIGLYAATCTDVFEVRTLRQLGDAVASIV